MIKTPPNRKRFFSGTSNLVLPVKNKNYLPPEFKDKTRLTYYSTLFNSVEINASFYKNPVQKTVEKWSNEVDNDFRFSFKLIKTVTHKLKQQFNVEPIPNFLSNINTEKRGCILIQLPPKFGPDIIQLNVLLNSIDNCGWQIAIEFRNKDWYKKEIFDFLYHRNISLVIHDMKLSATPLVVTSDTVYLRFHGPEVGYRGSYDESYLSEYADHINEWLDNSKTVYAYFNNTLGAAVKNLQTLNVFVNQKM